MGEFVLAKADTKYFPSYRRNEKKMDMYRKRERERERERERKREREREKVKR